MLNFVLTFSLLQFRKKFIRGGAENTVSLPISEIELKRKRTTFCILEFPLGNNSIQPHVLVVDISESIALQSSTPFFLTRELRACSRASCRYDVKNVIRLLDWSIPLNLFSILGF